MTVKDILARADELAAKGERLAEMGLPLGDWLAFMMDVRRLNCWRDLGSPKEITVYSAHGPVRVYEAPPIVLSVPSYSATITGIDPEPRSA